MLVPDGVCGYTERVTTTRFIYISVAGLVAVFGFFSNILLILFHTTPSKPPSHFPAFLALLDALLCFCFVVIFVVDVNMMYLELPGLFTFYHQYIVIAFSTAKVVQLLIPYMLIMATFERYKWIVKRKSTVSAKARPLSALILVIVATGIRIPAAMALTVTHFPDCPDFFRTLAVDVLPWAKESTIYAAFDIYGMAFLQTFLPFITLFSLNFIIIRKLCMMSSKMRRSSFAMLPGVRPSILSSLRRYKMPPTVRSAVYTMMAIVSTYLVCNSLHLVLTLLEVGNASILFEEFDSFQASTLYTTLGDTVSILYMTSSAIRILIYAMCNPAILKQLSSNEFLERFGRRKQSSDVIL
ncbi:unnamed protein product [Cylicocyclus nassatus]|uniref:G-protein coupled receptors family 1 profile domain-containing protein n=1 Tax=Cylicocyclus nassatus TaxID=53992 RepID=A0AA36DPV2_CYLNA|nr:unnamed protein product [Cylicocyclus nassatus]